MIAGMGAGTAQSTRYCSCNWINANDRGLYCATCGGFLGVVANVREEADECREDEACQELPDERQEKPYKMTDRLRIPKMRLPRMQVRQRQRTCSSPKGAKR